MSQSFLEIKGITKNFGGLRAVDDVSFSMQRDQVLGLIGPNGAGKTTSHHVQGGDPLQDTTLDDREV